MVDAETKVQTVRQGNLVNIPPLASPRWLAARKHQSHGKRRRAMVQRLADPMPAESTIPKVRLVCVVPVALHSNEASPGWFRGNSSSRDSRVWPHLPPCLVLSMASLLYSSSPKVCLGSSSEYPRVLDVCAALEGSCRRNLVN